MSENTKNSDEPVVCIELWILFENWNQCYKMRLKINEKKKRAMPPCILEPIEWQKK